MDAVGRTAGNRLVSYSRLADKNVFAPLCHDGPVDRSSNIRARSARAGYGPPVNPIYRAASHEYSATEFWISLSGTRSRPARRDESQGGSARVEESCPPRYTATARV